MLCYLSLGSLLQQWTTNKLKLINPYNQQVFSPCQVFKCVVRITIRVSLTGVAFDGKSKQKMRFTTSCIKGVPISSLTTPFKAPVLSRMMSPISFLVQLSGDQPFPGLLMLILHLHLNTCNQPVTFLE